MRHLSMSDVQDAVRKLAERYEPAPVFGVPRGGCVPAAMLAGLWGTELLASPRPGCLIVDDLVDSGATRERYRRLGYTFDALFHKAKGDGWIVLPWEAEDETAGPTDAVIRLLQHIGEDPHRDGLLRTPQRVVAALRELTAGYQLNVADVLAVQFDQTVVYTGIVVLRGIPFASLCEHHLLPFTGTADVAYVPGESGRIVGLSKLARLVDIYARRLQVQERMTVQIVEALVSHLAPTAAACVIRADHMCMSIRGVNKTAAGTVTSELRGAFFDDARARAELMQLLACK